MPRASAQPVHVRASARSDAVDPRAAPVRFEDRRLDSIDKILKASLATNPPRAGSLIVTVFGDSISQHGNAVWLGSLIEALAPFGLNARQIRTAVFRLVKNEWLSCVKIGRRSYCSLTEFGQRQYEHSARRIYAARPPSWDGQWTLVVPAFAGPEQRDRLKRELGWLGFSNIANGVLAHPCADRESLGETLRELDLDQFVVILRATAERVAGGDALKRLTRQSWQLDELEGRYADFVTRFRPALKVLSAAHNTNAAQLFELQTVVIHEYRRMLLKTSDLPDDLLPANWSGRAAMALTAGLYHALRDASAAHLEANLTGPQGSLAPAGPAYFRRFA